MSEISKTGIQFVPGDIKKELIGDASFLMSSAIKFIKDIENIIDGYKHIESIFKSENLSSLKEMMATKSRGLKKIIAAQYSFEHAVNLFLGRQIHFSWIDIETGDILLVEEISAEKIYKRAKKVTSLSQRSGGVGKISVDSKVREEIATLPSFVEKKYENKVQERINKHKELFQTVVSRLKQNQNEKNRAWLPEHKNTVYWEHPPINKNDGYNHPRWSWSMRTSPGDLSEAYVSFIFNSVNDLAANENGIGRFVLDNVEKHNTIPGIVKGDVDIEGTEVSIAVKSTNTLNTAGIGPYISVAFQIIQFYDNLSNLTIENVQGILDNLSKYDAKVVEAGKRKAEEILTKEITKTGGQVV